MSRKRISNGTDGTCLGGKGKSMAQAFNSAIWQLIKQSDWVSKYIVLLSLLVLSIVCVAIMIYKFMAYRQHKIALSAILHKLKRAQNLQDLVNINKEFQNSVGGELVARSLEDVKQLLEDKKQLLATLGQDFAAVSLQDLEIIDLMINQHIDDVLLEEESYLPVLGTSAAVGPLVGLFGTIWGLIHAFVNISQERSADIATVAPGIAEALITTLAGLIVAIPALVAFNYYSNELRKIETQLGKCGEIIMLLCKKTLLHRGK
jgi:biopolymer transport protein TolQ